MRLIDGTFHVVIALDGKTHRLGLSNTLDEAVAAQSAPGALSLV